MNWKQEAKERLSRLSALQEACRNIPAQIKQLENEIYRIKAAGIGPVSGNGGYSRGEDRLLNNMVCRQELSWALTRTRQTVRLIENALRQLDRQEYLILYRLYINPKDKPLEQLCQELEMEKSSIYRRRDRALERFTLSLYGLPEEA